MIPINTLSSSWKLPKREWEAAFCYQYPLLWNQLPLSVWEADNLWNWKTFVQNIAQDEEPHWNEDLMLLPAVQKRVLNWIEVILVSVLCVHHSLILFLVCFRQKPEDSETTVCHTCQILLLSFGLTSSNSYELLLGHVPFSGMLLFKSVFPHFPVGKCFQSSFYSNLRWVNTSIPCIDLNTAFHFPNYMNLAFWFQEPVLSWFCHPKTKMETWKKGKASFCPFINHLSLIWAAERPKTSRCSQEFPISILQVCCTQTPERRPGGFLSRCLNHLSCLLLVWRSIDSTPWPFQMAELLPL